MAWTTTSDESNDTSDTKMYTITGDIYGGTGTRFDSTNFGAISTVPPYSAFDALRLESWYANQADTIESANGVMRTIYTSDTDTSTQYWSCGSWKLLY